MALLVLIFMGATLGWLASIVVRVEDARGILAQIAIGAVACLLGAMIISNGFVFGALQWDTLGAGVAAAIVVLAGYNFWLSRQSGKNTVEEMEPSE